MTGAGACEGLGRACSPYRGAVLLCPCACADHCGYMRGFQSKCSLTVKLNQPHFRKGACAGVGLNKLSLSVPFATSFCNCKDCAQVSRDQYALEPCLEEEKPLHTNKLAVKTDVRWQWLTVLSAQSLGAHRTVATAPSPAVDSVIDPVSGAAQTRET